MAVIKNIPHRQIMQLADQIDTLQGQIVSKTLCQNDAVSVTLFAFSQGEEISTHPRRATPWSTFCKARQKLPSAKKSLFALKVSPWL